MNSSLNCIRLHSDRQHLICDDCVKDPREGYQNCSALYCVRQYCTLIYTLTWTVLTNELWFVWRKL